ncbi:ABC transporter substrate-binding protein/permease [Collinsella tanakaei]|uniref:ABC transporter substrate-binding protein/permease n=1 Tax=Collinsella tanakaei TaxID=626935 RepID=UPI001F43C12A|nr:ABC transporter substrate-binding protein/permease [Collinsella tanakaei]MCF2621824.1 ABC transporter permease subunit [Collinsella tanakaei]
MPYLYQALQPRHRIARLLGAAILLVACLLGGCSSSDASTHEFELVENGKLTVASDLATPPFEYTDDAGNPQGFTYDLMGMIAEELGLELNYLPAQKFDSIIPMTKQAVKTDVGACNITINDERLEEVDFTDPYMDSNQGIATVKDGGYDTVESLNAAGVRIAVQAGTTSEEWAIEHLPNAQTVNFDDWTAAFTAVMSGQCQGVVCDLPVEQWMVSNSFTSMQIIEEVPTGEQFGIAVSKDNPELTEAINAALADIRADGRYDKLYEEWFGVAPSSSSSTEQDDGSETAKIPDALTVTKASAQSNEDGGTAVLGGIATRLTWEATVGADAEVSQLTLTLPEGGSFEDSGATVYAVEDLTRTELACTSHIDDSALVIDFDKAVAAGTQLTVEVEGVLFPSTAGAYAVGGTYTSADGEVRDLPDSPTIAVSESTAVQSIVSWLDDQAWVQAWNANPFLGMFLRPQYIVTSIASLSQGWGAALLVTAIGFPLAVPLALLITFMKISRYKPLRAIAITYINVLRGTPLFLQIYIAFFGFPMLGLNLPNLPLGIGVLAINCSAYLAEIFRAGIQSIPRGQFEAARSQGFGFMSTMWLIILPQTFRRVIPTMTSELVMLYKDTSLLSSVGVMELMMFSKNLTAVTGNITPYIVAALYYLVVTIPLIHVITNVEKKMAAGEGRR